MIAESNCSKRQCKWFVGIIQPDGTERSEKNFCGAFPDGIPAEIAYGTNKHTAPLDKQAQPYTYEKSEDWENQFDKLPADDVDLWQKINGYPWGKPE